MQLDPPASKALALLHRLASDPGIVAIMNKVLNVVILIAYDAYGCEFVKCFVLVVVSNVLIGILQHRWRVGILTEMAPVGYVGVSPKCILGFNVVFKIFFTILHLL